MAARFLAIDRQERSVSTASVRLTVAKEKIPGDLRAESAGGIHVAAPAQIIERIIPVDTIADDRDTPKTPSVV